MKYRDIIFNFRNRKPQFFKKRKDWFERNPSKLQFFVTIIVLLVSAVFSIFSLKETRKQYVIIKGQLELSKEQFDSLKLSNRRNDILNHSKEIESRNQYIVDTSRAGRINRFQQMAAKKQIAINEEQYLAIKTQSDVAKKQLSFQDTINHQQLYNNRPIFFVLDVSIDSLSASQVIAKFQLVNTGKRVAQISKMNLIAWNEHQAYISLVTSTAGTFDLNPDKQNFLLPEIKIDKGAFSNKDTYYYITIYYTELGDDRVKTFNKFFTWQRLNNQFLWSTVLPDDAIMFESLIKKNGHKFPNLN